MYQIASAFLLIHGCVTALAGVPGVPDPNRHELTDEDLVDLELELSHARQQDTPPTILRRSRRQLMAGANSQAYVYDTETEEESGPWEAWQFAGGCSRTCGGGVLVETRTCGNPEQGKCSGPSKR